MLQEAVDNSSSVMGVLRFLNLPMAGGTHSHISSRLKSFEIDTNHFTGQGHNKGKLMPKKPASEVLVKRDPGSARERTNLLKRSMIEVGIPYTCSWCSLQEVWNGLPLVLHIDHVNGDWLDNTIGNLRFLCPNCHSQTATYCKTQAARVPKVRKPRPQPKLCQCGVEISKRSQTCRSCRHNDTVIDWPSAEVLVQMVESSNYSAVGRQLGVSDNAVRKRINYYK